MFRLIYVMTLLLLGGCAAESGSANSAQPPEGIAAYGQQLHEIVQQNILTTPAEQRAGLDGVTLVKAWLLPDGSIQSVSIYKSSGSSIIDQAAMDNVAIMTFPPFNSAMVQKPMSFVFPIEFRPH